MRKAQETPVRRATARERLSIGAALNRLHASAARWSRGDVSLTALSTLATLDRSGPRRITELATLEGVAQPSMTALVVTLERAGLAERRDDPSDRRATLIVITGAGAELLQARRTSGAEDFAELIAQLPVEESAALVAALPALRHLRELDERQRDQAGRLSRQSNPSERR